MTQHAVVVGTNPATIAINTTTLANMAMIVAKATMDLNSNGISSKFNGESPTMASLATMAAHKLKENLIAQANCQ